MSENDIVEQAIAKHFESGQITQEFKDRVYGAVDYIEKLDGEDPKGLQVNAINSEKNAPIKGILVDVFGGEEAVFGKSTPEDKGNKSEQPSEGEKTPDSIDEEALRAIVRDEQEASKANEQKESILKGVDSDSVNEFNSIYNALVVGGKSHTEAVALAKNALQIKTPEGVPGFGDTAELQTGKKEVIKIETSQDKAIAQALENQGVDVKELLKA